MRNNLRNLYYRNGRFSYYYDRPKKYRFNVTQLTCVLAVVIIATSVMMTHSKSVGVSSGSENTNIAVQTVESYDLYDLIKEVEFTPEVKIIEVNVTDVDDSIEPTESPTQVPESMFLYNNDYIMESSYTTINLVYDSATITSLYPVLGEDHITLGTVELVRLDLPDVYYGDIDYSSFQPYEDYKKITNTKSKAYKVVNADGAYTDEYGLRRFITTDDQYTIDGADDYIVALGTFYKEHGIIGNRYLIVTSTGAFTVKTGDEKSDQHTDEYNMFTMHGGRAGMIEWIVDINKLESSAASSGNITKLPVEALQGEILYIYQIYEEGS